MCEIGVTIAEASLPEVSGICGSARMLAELFTHVRPLVVFIYAACTSYLQGSTLNPET